MGRDKSRLLYALLQLLKLKFLIIDFNTIPRTQLIFSTLVSDI